MNKNEAKVEGNDNITIIDTNNSNITVNYGSNKELPILLTNLPEKPSLLLGRENKIKEVEEALESKKKAVIVNGFGGVGKTSVASSFFHEKTAHYSHKAWLRFTDNLIESYFTTPLPTHFDIIRRPEIPIDITISQLITKLENIAIDKKCLLVIDNVESADSFLENEKYLPKNWDILVTSRAVIEDSVKIFIDVLDEDDSIKLFQIHLDRNIKNEEITPLKELLSSIGRHTLTIELLAKIAKRGDLSINYLLERWNQYSFIDEELDYKINTDYKSNNKRIVKLKEILNAAFDLSNISSNESSLKLLKFFVILPTIENEFTIEKLEKLSGYEKRRELINNLQNLTEIGWLQTVKRNSDEKDIFFIHPLIQEVLLDKLDIENDLIATVIESFNLVEQELKAYGIFAEMLIYMERFKRVVTTENYIIQSFINSYLAFCYERVGKHIEAYDIYKSIVTESDNTSSIDVYINLATTCMSLGRHKEAFSYLNNCLKTFYPITGSNDITQLLDVNLLKELDKRFNDINLSSKIISACHEYGRSLLEQDEYEESLKIMLKVVTICKLLDKKISAILDSELVLSRIYTARGELNKAKKTLNELGSKLHVLEDNHPRKAVFYHENSMVSKLEGNFKEAIVFLLKTLNIEVANFGDENPKLILTYLFLAENYIMLENIEEASYFLGKCKNITSNNFISDDILLSIEGLDLSISLSNTPDCFQIENWKFVEKIISRWNENPTIKKAQNISYITEYLIMDALNKKNEIFSKANFQKTFRLLKTRKAVLILIQGKDSEEVREVSSMLQYLLHINS
ncbi:tetratricopeptide repeat protein (plasmid) [Bernardetia sp. Wsw4-3y2]|uniref:tetratricopeptide repeat protein n=1 Tax=Bernardetia sp. Wsw4-3y2 TaxID=3127471 RepID=UPI0030CB8CCF